MRGARHLRAGVTLVVATIGFAAALELRLAFDPWRTTALVALLAGALSLWTLGARARALFAISGASACVAIGIGALLVVVTHAGYQLIELGSPPLAATVRALYASVDVGASRPTLVLLTTVVVLGEELVWRGVAFDLGRTGGSRLTVAAISVALYVAPQLAVGVPLLILAAAGLGTFLAAQRALTGRLMDPFLTHLVWSVSVFILVPLAEPPGTPP